MNDVRPPASIGHSELSIIVAEHGVMKLAIARMVKDYRASLVGYIERAQGYMDDAKLDLDKPYDEYGEDPADSARSSIKYWRAELVEATRQLELNDMELFALIKLDAPHSLNARMENANVTGDQTNEPTKHEHIEDCFVTGEWWETAMSPSCPEFRN